MENMLEERCENMKVYISGPITGHPDYMERFQEAENYLKEKGNQVLNPARAMADLTKSIGFDLSYQAMLAMDIAILQDFDAIYMLKGFDESNGARTERARACALGLKIFYQEVLP